MRVVVICGPKETEDEYVQWSYLRIVYSVEPVFTRHTWTIHSSVYFEL
jgi:hypothetical protein